MRFLFVAYCFARRGEATIGVYKRCLRVARELWRRGHEVVVSCPGRQDYRDGLTEEAHRSARFLDIPYEHVRRPSQALANRAVGRAALAQVAPDLVVVGEAPLAGPMLETTLCALELGVPVALLDNAYGPSVTSELCRRHAPLADGLLLTGPTSFHMPEPPPRVVQVGPFAAASDVGRPLLRDLDLTGDRLVTVLAYDPKVERLGVSLAAALLAEDPTVEVVFVAPDPPATLRRAAAGAPGHAARLRAVAPGSDDELFGLLAASRLAVVKYGFMQLSECLALRTPAVVVYHHSFRWADGLPAPCRRFLHATDGVSADGATVAAAVRLLAVEGAEMAPLHEQEREAPAAAAADFLETLAAAPPGRSCVEPSAVGIPAGWIERAISRLTGGTPAGALEVRVGLMRTMLGYEHYVVLCRADAGDRQGVWRLWLHRFPHADAARRFARRLATSRGRNLLVAEPGVPVVVEEAGDEAMLLPIHWLPEHDTWRDRTRYVAAGVAHSLTTLLLRGSWTTQPLAAWPSR